MVYDLAMLKAFYTLYEGKIERIRTILQRPLTLAEKILYAHLYDEKNVKDYKRGEDYVNFRPDRVAMQDATAQMALLQFMNAGRDEVAVPSTVHCDHLIQAYKGAKEDIATATKTNEEVYNFLRDVSSRYGIGFWQPGAGIIHQVVLENYAFPGGMMVGTDSHTPNAGGLGMVATLSAGWMRMHCGISGLLLYTAGRARHAAKAARAPSVRMRRRFSAAACSKPGTSVRSCPHIFSFVITSCTSVSSETPRRL